MNNREKKKYVMESNREREMMIRKLQEKSNNHTESNSERTIQRQRKQQRKSNINRKSKSENIIKIGREAILKEIK